jgi:hypothetical protein
MPGIFSKITQVLIESVVIYKNNVRCINMCKKKKSTNEMDFITQRKSGCSFEVGVDVSTQIPNSNSNILGVVGCCCVLSCLVLSCFVLYCLVYYVLCRLVFGFLSLHSLSLVQVVSLV